MVLELYYDLLSQPCRAVYLFLKLTNVDFEPHYVSLVNRDHMKPEYLKLNPLHKAPVIKDGDYVLTESVAQLRYIAASKNLPESWYPRQDAQKEGRCDEFLNWHHTGLRKPCVELFLTTLRTKIAIFRFTKLEYDADKIKELKEAVEKAVKEVDEYYLKGKQFILGDAISAADLIGYCELIQLEAISQEQVYMSNANVGAWMKRVEAKLGSLKDEATQALKGIKEKYDSAE